MSLTRLDVQQVNSALKEEHTHMFIPSRLWSSHKKIQASIQCVLYAVVELCTKYLHLLCSHCEETGTQIAALLFARPWTSCWAFGLLQGYTAVIFHSSNTSMRESCSLLSSLVSMPSILAG